jgi:hypothetical protein
MSLPRLSYGMWVALEVRRRLFPDRLERIHLGLSAQTVRTPIGSTRDRLRRVLDLLEQDQRHALPQAVARGLHGQLEEAGPAADRRIAGQDRWGRSRAR